METQIIFCTCEHSYQDKRYGKNQRVHNKGEHKGGGDKWTCTVCGREK